MVKRVIQHCCLLSPLGEPLSNYIWISDDLLKYQWQNFSCRRGLHSHPIRSRSGSISACNIQLNTCSNNTTTVYQSVRHGSNAPGPLEARRRRTLRKQMTGASNLGLFGNGLDFSGSPWRYDSTSEIKSGHSRVRRRGHFLYDAAAMVWDWWRADIETTAQPAEKIEKTETHARTETQTDPFTNLLSTLNIQWSERPSDINLLLEDLLTVPRTNRGELLSETCKWIRTEVKLGSMSERTVKIILWDLGRDAWLADYNLPKLEPSWRSVICQSIGEGIATSRVRQAKDFHMDTIWLLVRAFAHNQCCDLPSTAILTDILFSMAHVDTTIDIEMLSSVLSLSFTNGDGFLRYLRVLEEFLPAEVFAGGMIGLYRFAIGACKTKVSGFKQHLAKERLIRLLRWVAEDRVLQQHCEHPTHKVQWLAIEYDLQCLGISFVAAHLNSANPATVCKFILSHVITGRSIQNRQSPVHTKLRELFDELSIEEQTYAHLVELVQKFAPNKRSEVVRFLFEFFRGSDRPYECYNLAQSLFLHQNPQLRPSYEFFSREIEAWAQHYPVFALLLLSLDRRSGMMHHPVVGRVLAENGSELSQLPPTLLNRVAKTIIKAHGKNLRVALAQHKIFSGVSIAILQLLLEPLANSDITGSKTLSLAEEIITLLAPHSERLRKETSIAITNIMAIKVLDARRKMTPWKMEWLGQIVIRLEGVEVWMDTKSAIEARWIQIEEEERVKGRRWLPRTGWVHSS